MICNKCGCNNECKIDGKCSMAGKTCIDGLDKYLDEHNLEICSTEWLTEHDKQIRAEAIEEVIKLYKEFQPKLATNVYEFGERLRQMQKEVENEQ